MPQAKSKKTLSKSSTSPVVVKRARGRPRKKTVTTVSGLVSPAALESPSSEADQRKPEAGRQSMGKPGGNQLPQGANALRAAILELMRQKQAHLPIKAAEDILRILINV